MSTNGSLDQIVRKFILGRYDEAQVELQKALDLSPRLRSAESRIQEPLWLALMAKNHADAAYHQIAQVYTYRGESDKSF